MTIKLHNLIFMKIRTINTEIIILVHCAIVLTAMFTHLTREHTFRVKVRYLEIAQVSIRVSLVYGNKTGTAA